MSSYFKPILTTLLLCALAALVVPASAQTVPPDTIFINQIDQTAFPDVAINIRALDANNDAVQGLADDAITLYENGQRVESFRLDSAELIPTHVMFVIDRGQFSNFLDFERSALLQSFEQLVLGGFFRDGVDRVGIVMTDPSQPNDAVVMLEPTTSANEFRNLLPELPLAPHGRANSLQAVSLAYDRLTTIGDQSNTNMAIIYTGVIFDGSVQSVADREARALSASLRQDGVAFYGLQTRDEFGDPIRALADGSGGNFSLFLPDRDNSGPLDSFYRDITAQARSYVISWRSRVGDANVRTVAVTQAGVSAEEATAVTTYSAALEAPDFTITSPDEGTIFERNGTEQANGTVNWDRDTIPVEGLLRGWPDGSPRNIASVELFVNGVATQRIDNPETGTEVFPFNVSLDNVKENTTLPIALRIRDELGIEMRTVTRNVTVEVDVTAASNGSGSAGVSAETNAATQPEVVVVTSQATPQIVEVPVEVPVPGAQTACEIDSSSTDCRIEQVLTWLPWGLAALFGGAFIALAIKYRRQYGTVREAVAGFADDVRKTLLGGSSVGQAPLAQIFILSAREGLEGEVIDIFNDVTTIGRDPQLCDVLLYESGDENTSVSRRHCTVQYERTRGTFLLTDNQSSYGTRVNGRRIDADDPVELRSGDEVTLGALSRRGAKLRFEVGEVQLPNNFSTTEHAAAVGANGATHIDEALSIFDEIEEAEDGRTTELNPDIDIPDTELPFFEAEPQTDDDDWEKLLE